MLLGLLAITYYLLDCDGIRAAFTNIYLKVQSQTLFFSYRKNTGPKFYYNSPNFSVFYRQSFRNKFIYPINLLIFCSVVLAVLTFFCLANRDNRVSQYFLQITRKLQKKYFSNFWGRISILQKNLPKLILSSVIIWSLTILTVYLFFLNYVEGFTITDAACLTVLTTLSIAISTTPINLGTFEIIVSGYLIKIFSVPISEAIGLALGFHFLIVLPYVIVVPILSITKLHLFRRD